MKTKSFLLGAAALMLATSCSNDEVVKVAENSAAIGFSSFVNKSTRATDNTATTLQDLQVWGVSYRGNVGDADYIAPYAIFGGDKVSKNGNAWTYDNLRYWVAGNAYTFAAVAPANAKGVTVTPGTTADDVVKSITFVNPGDVDLLYNVVSVDAKPNLTDYKTVDFNLGHILSRIRFEFASEMADGYSIKVTDVKITNAQENGTYDPANPTWVVTGDENKVYEFTMTKNVAKIASKDKDDNVVPAENAVSEGSYLLPIKNKAYNVAFNIELIFKDQVNGTEVSVATYEHTATVKAQDYDLGYSYAFKTTITEENINPKDELYPIEFNVETVDDWKPTVDGTDVPFQPNHKTNN